MNSECHRERVLQPSDWRTRPLLPALLAFLSMLGWRPLPAADGLQVGVAQVDITPPLGFPMSGYYHERLATGTRDPLWAKAVVFRSGATQAAWVVCDLTGISVDLSTEVRRQSSEKTGIPAANIVISATHSHTAPDYYRSLYHSLKPASQASQNADPQRLAYISRMIAGTVQAIVDAHAAAQPVMLQAGSVEQATPVSFCRRFVMRDGSVRTWVGLTHPQALRATAPIDSEIGLLLIRRPADQAPLGLISNFALHLDTVGGLEWSGDYPYFIEQAVRQELKTDAISLFGTGCCGDVNHADPTGKPRLKTDAIGSALGATIAAGLSNMSVLNTPAFQVRSCTVPLPLQEVTAADAGHSLQLVQAAQAGEKIEFFEHVLAYKRLVLDQLRHSPSYVDATSVLSLGLTRAWHGVGDALPAEVTVMTLGSEVAIVFLPGEVFVELGLAIKHASPFRTTMVVELSQCVESIYIPNRQAYAGGGYEVTNSLVQPGSGEMLVEAAVGLLREAATDLTQQSARTNR